MGTAPPASASRSQDGTSFDEKSCSLCHGAKGEGNSAFPRLAGQHRDYIERQLEAFASKARANVIMHENSKNLTAEQIREVAGYLGSL